MKGVLWEIAKVVGYAVLMVMLAGLAGGGTGAGGSPHGRGRMVPRPREYRPTGGTRGWGTRGHENHR